MYITLVQKSICKQLHIFGFNMKILSQIYSPYFSLSTFLSHMHCAIRIQTEIFPQWHSLKTANCDACDTCFLIKAATLYSLCILSFQNYLKVMKHSVFSFSDEIRYELSEKREIMVVLVIFDIHNWMFDQSDKLTFYTGWSATRNWPKI